MLTRSCLRPLLRPAGALRATTHPSPASHLPARPTSVLPHQTQARGVRIILPPGPSGPRNRYERFQNRRKTIADLWQNSQGFRYGVYITAGGAIGLYVTNLETVPVSGRRRFNIVSAETESQLAKTLYESTLQEFGGKILPPGHPYTLMVRRVMKRLIQVSGLEDLNWEVYVIADNSIKNAFVIPGGKVFVFSGILPIAKNDDGLAAVLSHEISHIVAHHAAERMSQMFLVVAALWAAALVLGGSDGGLGRVLMDLVYLRPSSRKQEAEADYIGLMMMSQACYDPREAVQLWHRMEKAERGAPPQFLSTHPAHKTRIASLEEWMSEALSKQAESDCAATMDYADQFRRAFEVSAW